MSPNRRHKVLGWTASGVLRAMGPGYVKGGQIASTRRDLLPAWLCDGLDAAITQGRQRGREVSGSVAVVERVGNPDQAAWAVKRLRPRALRVLARNLRGLERTGRWMARMPSARGIPMAAMTRDLSAAIGSQADLVREQESLGRLSSMLKGLPVRVPNVDPARSTEDELWMEWLPRPAGNSMEHQTPEVRERLMTVLLEALFEMIFHYGFFHCDLHPGNWWPLSEDEIAIVDAGFMHEIEKEARWHFIEFFYGIAVGDGEHAYEHMRATGTVDPAREASLEAAVVALVESAHGAGVEEFSLAAFGRSLFEIQRAHGFQGDTSFIFPLVALLTVEGQLKQFSPGLDFQGLAKKRLPKSLLRLRSEFALVRR